MVTILVIMVSGILTVMLAINIAQDVFKRRNVEVRYTGTEFETLQRLVVWVVRRWRRSSTRRSATAHPGRSPEGSRSTPAMAPGCLRWYRLVVLVSRLMPGGREEYLDRVDEGLWDAPQAEHRELLLNFLGSAPAWVWGSWVQARHGRARTARRVVAGSSDRDYQG